MKAERYKASIAQPCIVYPGTSHFRFDFAIILLFFFGSNLLLMIFLCVGGHGCVRAYDLTQDMLKATATAAMQSMMLFAVLNTVAVRGADFGT